MPCCRCDPAAWVKRCSTPYEAQSSASLIWQSYPRLLGDGRTRRSSACELKCQGHFASCAFPDSTTSTLLARAHPCNKQRGPACLLTEYPQNAVKTGSYGHTVREHRPQKTSSGSPKSDTTHMTVGKGSFRSRRKAVNKRIT